MHRRAVHRVDYRRRRAVAPPVVEADDVRALLCTVPRVSLAAMAADGSTHMASTEPARPPLCTHAHALGV
jgi:hypothetical protein